ncbi:MAG: hypothetical protein WEB00_10340 [Dehalococcoidia bacterium]
MTTGNYWVVRFTPDPVRDEPINIGLAMAGDFRPRISFPTESLARAGRWSSYLDGTALLALAGELEDRLSRALATHDDLPGDSLHGMLGEFFGQVSLSEARWIDLETDREDEVDSTFKFICERLVLPPKPVVYGGGTPAAKKVIKQLFPIVKQGWPRAVFEEELLGRSGRPFVADIYSGGSHQLIVSALVLSSTPQAIAQVEARAFELQDVGKTLPDPHLTAVCQFPEIDPRHVEEEAIKILESVDVQVLTPQTITNLSRAEVGPVATRDV